MGAEICSADARQVYKGLDIGTGKAKPEELACVRHHLIDTAYPNEPFDAGRYLREIESCLQSDNPTPKTWIVAGGTGLYIRAAAEGLSALPTIPPSLREELRLRLAAEGLAVLVDELRRLDTQAATRIDLNNPARVVRALELIRASGQSLASLYTRRQAAPLAGLVRGYLYLRPDRSELYRRIDARVEAMWRAGWPDEVAGLLNDYPETAPAFNAIGYREVIDTLAGRLRPAEAIARIQQLTRNYAKRQYTWFDHQLPKHGSSLPVLTFAAADASALLTLIHA